MNALVLDQISFHKSAPFIAAMEGNWIQIRIIAYASYYKTQEYVFLLDKTEFKKRLLKLL